MKALALDPKVLSLANTLGIDCADPVQGIRNFCGDRLRLLTRRKEAIEDIRELQKVVCEKLNLTVHEIWSDPDLDALIRSYVADGEPVFAFLSEDLSSGTYGVLIRLRKQRGSRFGWVAVVDCRGDKGHRRFFTIWHEIVHCLTAADQYELPFHRTRVSDKPLDPIERLTDIVAGDLAFFESLFCPVLEEAVMPDGRITFSNVEMVRERYCSDASFESTLNACVSHNRNPTLFIKASLSFKNAERDAMNSPQRQLFAVAQPAPRLRVVSTISNDAARLASFRIHRNMRVPASSVISAVFFDPELLRGSAEEDLRDWTSSDGASLLSNRVAVEARKIGDQVFALMSPVSRA